MTTTLLGRNGIRIDTRVTKIIIEAKHFFKVLIVDKSEFKHSELKSLMNISKK